MVENSVAELVERQHFAGAEAFWPGSGNVNLCKSYRFIFYSPVLKFEVEFKEPYDDQLEYRHLCF
jgi:hypothetical protein